MPPRSSLAASFTAADASNEVVCPLRNQDGSSCRKRCIGEKRYRSMQEHIRRAHPEHYISKLPATEESFMLMISTPPSERPPTQQQPQPQPQQPSQQPQIQVQQPPPQPLPPAHHTGNNINALATSQIGPIDPALSSYPPRDRFNPFRDPSSAPGTPGHAADDYNGTSLLPAASAAAATALAQLGQTQAAEWDSGDDWQSDNEGRRIPRTTIELPPIQVDPTSDPYPPLSASRPRDLLPSILSNSPPGRSSTLPPLQRPLGPNRPRKQSVTKRAHKKQRSRGTAADWLRRIQNDDRLKPGSADRKAQSVEPMADNGRRWEDLIEAAASATEDIEDDRTPAPQSPVSVHRASVPPLFPHHQPFGGYQASPLQQALTPPSFVQEPPGDPFPSVESGESGDNFHMGAHGLGGGVGVGGGNNDSSPSYSAQHVHIYCAACQRTSRLRESYACTECICGLCRECVNVLMEEQGARRKCPRCATIGGRFKPFQLDIR